MDEGGISLMEEGARNIEAVWWEAFVLFEDGEVLRVIKRGSV